MKRSVQNVRLNSEFKRVQRLPLLAADAAGLVAPACAIPATPSVEDSELALLKRESVGAEIHELKCTNSY